VCKIIALGHTDAEEAALLWASDHGVETDETGRLPNTSHAFTPIRLTGRAVSRHMEWLLENVLQSEGTLLLTVNFPLGPEQKKAIEFLGANKPFLHLWSSSIHGGLACP
jgi:hypothetical protein